MTETPWQKSKEYLARAWYNAVAGTTETSEKPFEYWLWMIFQEYGGVSSSWRMPANYWLFQIYQLVATVPVAIVQGQVQWQKPEEYWARLIYARLSQNALVNIHANIEYWLYNIRLYALPEPQNLKLWLDSTRIVGLTDGQGVAQWDDLSGNSNHSTQAVGAQQLRYYTTTQTMNGYPVVWADGVSNYSLATPSMFNSGYDKAFTVIALTSLTGTDFVLGLNDATDGFRLSSDSGGGLGTIGYRHHSGNLSDITIPSGDPLNLVIYGPTLPRITAFTYDGAVKTHWRMGTKFQTKAATGNLGLTGALRIGRYEPGGFLWSGGFGHLLIYQSVPTDAQMVALQRYVAGRFALSMLPQIHCNGDSLTYGTGATHGVDDYPTQLQQLLGGAGAWNRINTGNASTTLADMITGAPTVLAAFGQFVDPYHQGIRAKNIHLCWGGTNDILGGANAITTQTRTTTYFNARTAAQWDKLVDFTILPRAGFDAGMETIRLAVNTWKRANYASYASRLVDVAADPRLDDYTDTAYYSIDRTHLNPDGYGVVAELSYNEVSTL